MAVEARGAAIARRRTIRKELKQVEQELSLNLPHGQVQKLLLHVSISQKDAETAQLARFQQEELIERCSHESGELSIKIQDLEKAIIQCETQVYHGYQIILEKKANAEAYLQKITEISDELQGLQQEMSVVENTIRQKMLAISKEAQAKFESALQKKLRCRQLLLPRKPPRKFSKKSMLKSLSSRKPELCKRNLLWKRRPPKRNWLGKRKTCRTKESC
jgi:chromosome segregation ATPase